MNLKRYEIKIRTFVQFAIALSKLSTCKRHQNGAIIFPMDCSAVYSIGYKGPPRGMDNDSCINIKGDCGCVHAEANTIIKLNPEIVKPCILYTTTSPCINCANAIMNCGIIDAIIFQYLYRDEAGLNRIRDADNNIDVMMITKLNYILLNEWKLRI